MNKLSSEARSRILRLLCEGQSLRATALLTGASKNTIAKLLVTAGRACMAYQDRALVNLPGRKWRVDELWSFVGAKEKSIPVARKRDGTMGDVWTWIALDAESKLVGAWYIGSRDADAAISFMGTLAKRLANQVQLTSDGHGPYLQVVEGAFGANIDYAMLQKIYGPAPEGSQRCYNPDAHEHRIEGKLDHKHISTGFVERSNGIIRQYCKRYARLTLTFSKKLEDYAYAFALHTMYHNFIRISAAHRMSPAMTAGVTGKLWATADLVAMVEEWEAAETKDQSNWPTTGSVAAHDRRARRR